MHIPNKSIIMIALASAFVLASCNHQPFMDDRDLRYEQRDRIEAHDNRTEWRREDSP